MKDTYQSLATTSEGEYKEKGSKFIALAFPVTSIEEIKTVQAQLRKKYYDARHHCYAYRIGRAGDIFRANDDGEPSNSAGAPILGQLKSYNISDVLVVVIRYFGGTKLGVSGLINAYKTATIEAIEANQVIKKIIYYDLNVHFQYDKMNTIMSLVKKYDLDILAQDFQLECDITLQIRESLLETITNELTDKEGISYSEVKN